MKSLAVADERPGAYGCFDFYGSCGL